MSAAAAATTAAEAGLLSCHACHLLNRRLPGAHAQACARCGAALHPRKPDSLSRTWAFLIASYVLIVPANLLPVMISGSLFGSEADTIMSGVVYLWTSGSWPLAVILFGASIVIPAAKLLVLTFLVVSVQRGSAWALRQRTQLYRAVELIGRWSMIDVYVAAILTALVHFGSLMTIRAGPGAIAFGAVVVLTMFAAESFDPRLIWDRAERRHG
jgi:paraquat-inducible protein A